jgi:hypothetical protein
MLKEMFFVLSVSFRIKSFKIETKTTYSTIDGTQYFEFSLLLIICSSYNKKNFKKNQSSGTAQEYWDRGILGGTYVI